MSEVIRRIPGADRGMGCEMEDASRYAGFGDESILRTYVEYTDYVALETRLKAIAKLGANPITEQGCYTRADYMRLVDKMWQIASGVE